MNDIKSLMIALSSEYDSLSENVNDFLSRFGNDSESYVSCTSSTSNFIATRTCSKFEIFWDTSFNEGSPAKKNVFWAP